MSTTTPITTLKKRADFVRLNRARKFMTEYFILRYGASPDAALAQFGYTVTVKCGNAVVRNRMKRRLRALVRELFPSIARAGHDYIIIARNDAKPSAADVAYDELRTAMRRAMANIHPHA